MSPEEKGSMIFVIETLAKALANDDPSLAILAVAQLQAVFPKTRNLHRGEALGNRQQR